VTRRRVRINGARGWTMFFFGLSALTFGVAFFGPWKVTPPPPRGLAGLDAWIPLDVWGLLWVAAGLFLLVSSFRDNQSAAMGSYAAMLFVWWSSYTWTAVSDVLDTGSTNLWLASCIYGSLLGACVGVARLVNAPPDLSALVTKEGTGDDS